MLRVSLAAAAVAACLAPIGAQAFDPPTASEFFGRFEVPEEIGVELQDDGSVILSAPAGYDGRLMFSLREDEVPEPGNRALSVEVTVLEDGGGWPDALVGFGMIHGYREGEPNEPFSVGVVSPQDGGTLRLGAYTGNGFDIGQALGSGGTRIGDTIRLTMREEDRMLTYEAASGASSSQSATSNDLIAAGMEPGTRIGFILVSGGTYRISDLHVTTAR